MNEELTGKQELFAMHYALSGNGAQSALKAGCSRKSAHVTASRWLNLDKVLLRIEELRDHAFLEWEGLVLDNLTGAIVTALKTGAHCCEARRAISLLRRLGVFRHERLEDPAVSAPEEIFKRTDEELEQFIAERRSQNCEGTRPQD